jgi:CheY-like chemotaxis protein
VRLRRAGYDTAFAGDAISAVSVARKEEPDLILLDLGLPGGEGFVVLDRLRAIAALGWVPVIVITARADPTSRQRAEAAGVKAYLQKPIDVERLLAEISRQLASSS